MHFLDLFAGIGGFRLGMEMAGHKCAGFVEIDKFARKSYEAIHNTEGEWNAKDIRSVTNEEWRKFKGKVNVICAGFPCQPFAICGTRKGFQDTRGTLFFEIARAANEIKPAFLFLENVRGLLNHESGNTYRKILQTLDELGYDAEWQICNSKYYVPQNRERVFIIGHTREKCTRKVFPLTGENGADLIQLVGGKQGQRVYDSKGLSCTLKSGGGGGGANSGLYFIDMQYNKPDITDISRCLTTKYRGVSNRQGERTGILHSDVPLAILNPDRVNKRQNGSRIKDGEMFTLMASEVHGIIQHSRIRRLTPKESFRLQGYPDWSYEKAASVNSDTQLFRQIGNSVTINVIFEIAKRLKIED